MIGGKFYKDARISINNGGNTYICHDDLHGASAVDLLGFKGSWFIGTHAREGSEIDILSITPGIAIDYEIF
jgi:hypothetical protein